VTDPRTSSLLVSAVALAAAWAVGTSEASTPMPERGRSEPGHVVYLDIEGWYRRTPDEVAALSPFDLSLDALPASLPLVIGDWQGAEREPDPGVREWFGDPPVVVERTYWRAEDEIVWVSAFGNRGDPSFHLFEHTPETCYPLSGWNIRSMTRKRIAMGDTADGSESGPRLRPITVNAGEAVDASGAELAFLYVYVWSDPSRDPATGVVSLRLTAPVVGGRDIAHARRLIEHDFLRLLFESTLPWTGF
jgi:hypothetical protein